MNLLTDNSPALPRWFVPLGRAIVASLFVLGGVNKILNYAPTLAFMQDVGLPASQVLLPLTILLELGGGLALVFGAPFHRWIAVLLAGFTVLVNFIFHAFWTYAGPDAVLQLSLFFKNIAVVGALLLIAAIPVRPKGG